MITSQALLIYQVSTCEELLPEVLPSFYDTPVYLINGLVYVDEEVAKYVQGIPPKARCISYQKSGYYTTNTLVAVGVNNG